MTPQPPAGSSKPPQVGCYYLLQTIGLGNGTKVKKGLCSETNRHVAVKIQRKKEEGEADARREIDILCRLSQEVGEEERRNVVQLLDVMESQKCLYTVLELVEGGDLFTALEEGLVDTSRDPAWIFADVASGLLCLHTHLVAHRDVKPENILVDFPGRTAKLSDLGLAKQHETSGEESAEAVGTPGYAPPELLDPTVSSYNAFAADVWSYGASLFTAHTGSFLPKHRLRFPDTVPPAARRLLLLLLTPEPSQRPTFRDILNHSFFEGGYQTESSA